ncbi:MAG: hypothetical protein JNM41_07140 [Flavipsychrobacter sp.]|nr:hypothetical protein [Flavipsychrobacter sp.]
MADSTYYYLYLPATFIYNDLGGLNFYDSLIHKYSINSCQPTYEVYPQKSTGYKVNKYAVGVSIFELPFFALAHTYCLISKEYPSDGYSTPYRVSIVFAYLFWVLFGMFALRAFLLKYFNDNITAITLLLLLFGTNLYFYTVFFIGMSHPISFSLFCFLLYFTNRAYSRYKSIYVVIIGLILGLILIVRPTNIIVAIIPIFWPYRSFNEKVDIFKKKSRAIAIALICFCATAFIQFSYLKYTSGNWFHFSYQEEYFNFKSPMIYDGLFSYRKGWFIYTPLALISIWGLILMMVKKDFRYNIYFLYIIINIYIVFSWHAWSYGGGFGCRPLVESMAIMSIPIAYFINKVMLYKKRILNIIIIFFFSFFVILNLFQSYQLMYNVLSWDGITEIEYWNSFGKLPK